MSDIAIIWTENGADIGIGPNDFATDDGLETAIYISLFTDARAPADADLPTAERDRRGWWGDIAPEVEGDRIGSLLWLLAREKQTTAVVARAEQYAREALEWLVEDRVASRVEVEAELVAEGVLGIGVRIYRPSSEPVRFRYEFAWERQAEKRAA